MRYSYSKTIVYNCFVWPNPDENQWAKIESTAQKILDARNLYPASSFADIYDEASMPVEFSKAHRENDEAVCEAYGWPEYLSEEEIVARLFRLYHELM